jgi:hypothetical protein
VFGCKHRSSQTTPISEFWAPTNSSLQNTPRYQFSLKSDHWQFNDFVGSHFERVMYCYSMFLFHSYYITPTAVGWCIVILLLLHHPDCCRVMYCYSTFRFHYYYYYYSYYYYSSINLKKSTLTSTTSHGIWYSYKVS